MPAQWPSQPMSTLKAMPSLLLDLHTFFGLYPWIYLKDQSPRRSI